MGNNQDGNKMRKLYFIIGFVLFFPVFSGLVSASEKIAVVKTKENYIREFDRFYAPVKAKVQFEDQLQIIETKNDWLRVRFRDVEGWIHSSAVVSSRKMAYKPVMLGSEIDPEAEEDEVTLAGKGFNAQIEKKVGEKNPELNFAKVDEIANYDVSPAEINTFIKNGGLNLPK